METFQALAKEWGLDKPILEQYERQGHPDYSSARLWDDGVLDPAFIPRSAVADAIAEAFAGVQSLPLPGAATLNQAVATLNQILAILKGE